VARGLQFSLRTFIMLVLAAGALAGWVGNRYRREPGHNYLCSGLRHFFAYADPYLRQIASQVGRRRAMHPPP
jgi:sulfatase maturation enzyme AslB (radical SAM superfamily)